MHPLRPYLLLAAWYVSTRAGLYAWGLRVQLYDDWLFFIDPALLTARPLESLWAFHVFPPGMSALAAMGLALGAPLVFWTWLQHGLGLGLGLSMAVCGRQLGLSWRVTGPLVMAFWLLPASVYFEGLVFHTLPSAAGLMMVTVAAHAARARGPRALAGALVLAALLGCLRSTFHLVWLVGTAGLAVAAMPDRRRALPAVLPAILLLGALYGKNAVLVGHFAASTWTGFNLSKVTTQQLSRAERRSWFEDGRLHAASLRPLYAPIDVLSQDVDVPPATGIPVLDQHTRAGGRPNPNHRVVPVVARARMHGNLAYLASRPVDYLNTVAQNAVAITAPSTRWHPRDPEGSPHAEHRARLGGWEDTVHAMMHPVPVGVYVVLPLAWGGMVIMVWRRRRQPDAADPLRLALAWHITWVLGVSCLVETGELARYRYLVEAPIWLIVADSIRLLIGARSASDS